MHQVKPPAFVEFLMREIDREIDRRGKGGTSGTKCHTQMSHFRDNKSQTASKTGQNKPWHDICNIFCEDNKSSQHNNSNGDSTHE